MVEQRQIYYCNTCKSLVEVLNDAAPPLVCCSANMELLEEQTKDASTEKHVPYVEQTENGVLVKVGQNTAHPMEEKHYIKFIEVQTRSKVLRHELNPGDAPEAEFAVNKEDIIKVREWCNIHGLWKS